MFTRDSPEESGDFLASGLLAGPFGEMCLTRRVRVHDENRR